MVHDKIIESIAQQRLSDSFIETVNRWYNPIAEGLAAIKSKQSQTLVLGVQGCQGSGKSTLASFLRIILMHKYKLNTVVLSIDDFYLTLDERLSLSQSVHPLLITRGVPGTHDVELACSVINKLKAHTRGDTTAIPRFDKAADDRKPPELWDQVQGTVDVIIFEGWCIAAPPQSEQALVAPVNQLEADEDPDLIWRTYVNAKLANTYPPLFDLLDKLLILNAPSFASVYEWRLLQEMKLAQSSTFASKKSFIMSEERILRFISHYQRLTEHCLGVLQNRADWMLALNDEHEIIEMRNRVNYAE